MPRNDSEISFDVRPNNTKLVYGINNTQYKRKKKQYDEIHYKGKRYKYTNT